MRIEEFRVHLEGRLQGSNPRIVAGLRLHRLCCRITTRLDLGKFSGDFIDPFEIFQFKSSESFSPPVRRHICLANTTGESLSPPCSCFLFCCVMVGGVWFGSFQPKQNQATTTTNVIKIRHIQPLIRLAIYTQQ